MKALINGRIVCKDGVATNKVLLYDTHIVGLAEEVPQDCETLDAHGQLILPGLIDMHTHGYRGQDVSDGTDEAIQTIAEGIVENGVTGYLPTTMALGYDDLRKAFGCVRRAMRKSRTPEWNGAQVLGLNAEGPFFNPAKRGAHEERFIRPADSEFLKEFLDILRVFTIAPEIAGNLECIREMANAGVLVSIGHTNATYDQTMAGIRAGARHITHLFNAQTGLLHREPGVVGAALSDDRISVELIADGFHVHKALFPIVARQKRDKLCLITDCTRAGGMPDGEYTLGKQTFTLKGIQCLLPDGTIAGSVLRLNQAVYNLLQNTDLTIFEAVNAASLNPAKVLGLDDEVGSIRRGRRADFAIATDTMRICTTIIGGRIVYQA